MPQSSALPSDFQFSQSALQDFADCPARFYLRYVRQLRYPAPETEPLREFERQAERGTRFHRLVHQSSLGIPPETLAAGLADETLGRWWANFRAHAPLPNLPPQRHWEITLSAPLAGRRLVARFDLLALAPDRTVIVDWKTAPRRPDRAALQRRLQTVVYPYLLARAGAHLNGGNPIQPGAITMIYWFAEFPQQPESFAYSAAQFKRDSAQLAALAADILARPDESAFTLTDDLERCRFCSYRSLHERGTQAGDFHDLDADDPDDLALHLDLDQIGEIEF